MTQTRQYLDLVRYYLRVLGFPLFSNKVDLEYFKLIKLIMRKGVKKNTRNGITKSIFGYQCRFDLTKNFPILTMKKTLWKPIVHELIWFLKGDTSPKYLHDNNVKIWDLWINDKNDLPLTYPHQWRKYGKGFDQIKNAINLIKNDPNSRRIIVSAWNPEEVEDAALPWCHTLFQFYVSNGKLSCHLYQRSSDIALSWSYNISSYSLLTFMMAQVTGLEPGEFIWSVGDVHIYENQISTLKTQLSGESFKLPTVQLNKSITEIDSFKFQDIKLLNYQHGPFVKIPVTK